MNVCVEVFFTNRINGQIVFYRKSIPLDEVVDPTEYLNSWIAKKHPGMLSIVYLLHSTSWRYLDGDIMLTYIFYSDNFDIRDTFSEVDILDNIYIERSDDTRDPSPEDISIESVLSHGLRHISFLLENDKKIKNSNAISEENRKYLRKLRDVLAGNL